MLACTRGNKMKDAKTVRVEKNVEDPGGMVEMAKSGSY